MRTRLGMTPSGAATTAGAWAVHGRRTQNLTQCKLHGTCVVAGSNSSLNHIFLQVRVMNVVVAPAPAGASPKHECNALDSQKKAGTEAGRVRSPGSDALAPTLDCGRDSL